MKKKFVADLNVGDLVADVFLVVGKSLHKYQKANTGGEGEFLRLVLGDNSGTINAVMWEGAGAAYRSCETSPLVRITGRVTTYREQPQVTVEGLTAVNKQKVNLADFQRASERDRREMVEEIQELARELNNPFLRELIFSFIQDRQFLVAFADAPAAKAIHHAYVGGLLEHTLETVAICLEIFTLYPRYLNRDLLVAGAILHDIGKIKEYDAHALNFEITDSGKLFGHIVLGHQMVKENMDKIDGFPPDLAVELLHMILSHHGQRSWGSPEPPKTMNAFALHHADYLGAQLNYFQGLMEKNMGRGTNWTPMDYKLERSVFLGFLPEGAPMPPADNTSGYVKG
ncbi:MAG: HD domain-containing protein [Firmicutes bacterium]|nr:HD domain-containing protein [Bacillota bacterium]